MRRNAQRIFILILSITLFSMNFQTSMAGADVWTTQGPFGLRFFTLIIDPGNPDILYAFTIECDNIGVTSIVFKSLNGGVDWFPSGSGIPLIDCGDLKSNGMVMDPSDSNTLYIANELGIYKTTDGAQSWTQITNMRTSSLAISTHGRIFAGVYEAYGYSGGIYRSDDGGSSWEMASAGIPSQIGVASALAIAPGAPHIIYAGLQGAGLYKSLDSGDTWQPINNGFFTYPQVRLIAVDPYDSQVVYFSALAGLTLFRSDNGGASWQPIGEGLPSEPFSLVIDPGNQQVIYAGTWSGVYRSLDNLGQNWEPFSEGMGSRFVSGLAIDHQQPQTIYAATQAGIWKRTLVSDNPQDYSVTINNGDLYTNQEDVILGFTAPYGTSQMIVSNDGGFAGAAWEPFSPSRSWTITSYGQTPLPRTVYVKFRSGSSISGLYQDDVIYDPNPPSGSLIISGTLFTRSGILTEQSFPSRGLAGSTIYLPVLSKNSYPGYTQVSLHLSAQDDLSGVAEMIIGLDLDFTAAQWEPYLEWKKDWVPAKGATTVYARFRDRAGNLSTVVSDTYTP